MTYFYSRRCHDNVIIHHSVTRGTRGTLRPARSSVGDGSFDFETAPKNIGKCVTDCNLGFPVKLDAVATTIKEFRFLPAVVDIDRDLTSIYVIEFMGPLCKKVTNRKIEILNAISTHGYTGGHDHSVYERDDISNLNTFRFSDIIKKKTFREN